MEPCFGPRCARSSWSATRNGCPPWRRRPGCSGGTTDRSWNGWSPPATRRKRSAGNAACTPEIASYPNHHYYADQLRTAYTPAADAAARAVRPYEVVAVDGVCEEASTSFVNRAENGRVHRQLPGGPRRLLRERDHHHAVPGPSQGARRRRCHQRAHDRLLPGPRGGCRRAEHRPPREIGFWLTRGSSTWRSRAPSTACAWSAPRSAGQRGTGRARGGRPTARSHRRGGGQRAAAVRACARSKRPLFCVNRQHPLHSRKPCSHTSSTTSSRWRPTSKLLPISIAVASVAAIYVHDRVHQTPTAHQKLNNFIWPRASSSSWSRRKASASGRTWRSPRPFCASRPSAWRSSSWNSPASS